MKSTVGAFWAAAHELDADVQDESELAGAREGHLAVLFAAAGLGAIESTTLVADLEHPTFDSWWAPFTQGVGPAGGYVAALDPERREALRRACLTRLGDGPFVIPARAWAVRGIPSAP